MSTRISDSDLVRFRDATAKREAAERTAHTYEPGNELVLEGAGAAVKRDVNVATYGGLQVEEDQISLTEVSLYGEALELTEGEYHVLLRLVRAYPLSVSAEQLSATTGLRPAALVAAIVGLREKLGEDYIVRVAPLRWSRTDASTRIVGYVLMERARDISA